MRLHDEFEWDEAKAEVNLRKHGVSFDDAATALEDPNGDFTHHEQYDKAHSRHEDRFATYTFYPPNRSIVLAIVWTTMEEDGGEPITRIISARFATPKERKAYEKYILRKMGS